MLINLFYNFQVYNILCWALSLGVMLLIILFQYPINQPNYEYVRWIDVTYTSLHRVFWSIALSWIIFACSFGYGGKLMVGPRFPLLKCQEVFKNVQTSTDSSSFTSSYVFWKIGKIVKLYFLYYRFFKNRSGLKLLKFSLL